MYRATENKPLSPLELQVMEMLWARTSMTADDVRTALSPARPLKDSTIRTVLRRLEEKGYLEHSTEGRTFIYKPKDSAQRTAGNAVRQIIDRFWNGSVEQFLLGMVQNEIVDEDELKRLAARIAEAREKG
jgi:BlaI family transcriptional regulator, penicillinase repressor